VPRSVETPAAAFLGRAWRFNGPGETTSGRFPAMTRHIVPTVIGDTYPTSGLGFGRKPGALSSSVAAGKNGEEVGSGNGAVVLRNDSRGWLKSVSTSGAFNIGCSHCWFWVFVWIVFHHQGCATWTYTRGHRQHPGPLLCSTLYNTGLSHCFVWFLRLGNNTHDAHFQVV
jgi:hypothetical protein